MGDNLDDSMRVDENDDIPAPDPHQYHNVNFDPRSPQHDEEHDANVDIDVIEEMNDDEDEDLIDEDKRRERKRVPVANFRNIKVDDAKEVGVASKENTVKVLNEDAVKLHTIIESYSPNALISRLEMIFDCCPPLEKESFQALVNVIKERTNNVTKYQQLYAKIEQKPIQKDLPPMDKSWIETTQATSITALEYMLQDLKRQKDEGVKESIRRCMDDLVKQYSSMGQHAEAVKMFAKGMRDNCTQMRLVINMYLAWIECTITANEWHRVDPLTAQAERALVEAEDADNQQQQVGSRLGRVHIDNSAPNKAIKSIIYNSRSKMAAMAGLAALQAKKYTSAADKFTLVDVDVLDSEWLVAPFDVARYGTLLSLATVDRNTIKAKCLDTKFRKAVETEPLLMEMINCFTHSQFGRCFDILGTFKDTMYLDPFFYPHVNSVFSLIRRKALTEYLRPFEVADLNAMATVFRTDVSKLCVELMELMDADELVGKMNEKENVIEMREGDKRTALHKQAIDTCDAVIERAEWHTFRAMLQQNKLYVLMEEKPNGNRGKRRTNDESDCAPAHSSQGKGARADNGGPGSFIRAAKNTMQRIIGGSSNSNRNEADSPSDGGDPIEPN